MNKVTLGLAGHRRLDQEIERLECLIDCGLLDTPREERFDRITRIAKSLFNVPMSAVSLLDLKRQWFKSKQGIEVDETPRAIAFCDHAIREDAVLAVPDAQDDVRFADNPLVTGETRIRFYAGAPLTIRDGLRIGTLCVMDTVPREFSEEQSAMLSDLAKIVIDEINLNLACSEAQEAKDLLYDAVEAVPDGFVLYNDADRLVICNEKYKELYRESAEFMTKGARFETIIREGVANGQYPEAKGSEEQWVRERLAKHRNPAGSIQQQLPDGRWLRVMETKTSRGGTVGFRVDITELKMREAQLKDLLITDTLTGALSRREVLKRGVEETKRATRYGRTLSLVYIDIDHFKSVNDTYGHAAGDKILNRLTTIFRRMARECDHFGRLGGEEFLLILPETALEDAIVMADRVRETIEASLTKIGSQEIAVTVSGGAAELRPDMSFEDLLAVADKNLYAAKSKGRNQVLGGR